MVDEQNCRVPTGRFGKNAQFSGLESCYALKLDFQNRFCLWIRFLGMFCFVADFQILQPQISFWLL